MEHLPDFSSPPLHPSSPLLFKEYRFLFQSTCVTQTRWDNVMYTLQMNYMGFSHDVIKLRQLQLMVFCLINTAMK